jgi:hypothetical protein
MKALQQRISELKTKLFSVRASVAAEGKSFGFVDAWNLFQTILSELIKLVEELLTETPGLEKKALVLKYAEELFDNVIVKIDIPYVPSVVEKIMYRYIKRLFMALADGAIDSIVTLLNKLGVFSQG